ncbi:MAG: hypothetical protein QOG49_717, partial [Frankiaceae bacterium]|nr:hypothetical protein [Frankiaceae bacterium]
MNDLGNKIQVAIVVFFVLVAGLLAMTEAALTRVSKVHA